MTKEWQCSCGVWIPVAYGRHPHIHAKLPSMGDFMAMRAAEEAGLSGVAADVMNTSVEITHEWRTAAHPTREAQNGC